MQEDRLLPSVKSRKPRVATRLPGIHLQRKYLDDSASASFGESAWYLRDAPRPPHYDDGLKTYVDFGVWDYTRSCYHPSGDYGRYGDLRLPPSGRPPVLSWQGRNY